tara:strand:- start:80 stop:283 length:204 start_codon:yes stop_codon:yes gene_type:complete
MNTNATTRRLAADYQARIEAADPQRATPKMVSYAFNALVTNLRRLNPSMDIGVIRRFAKQIGAGRPL